jgi:hypothetical protein
LIRSTAQKAKVAWGWVFIYAVWLWSAKADESNANQSWERVLHSGYIYLYG